MRYLQFLLIALLVLGGGGFFVEEGVSYAWAEPPQTPIQAAPGLVSQVAEMLRWFLVVELLGFVVCPWLAWAFPMLPDKGWGVSKGVGVAWFGWLVWYLRTEGVITHTVSGAVFIGALCLIATGTLCFLRRRFMRAAVREARATIMLVEGLFVGAFVLLALLKSFQPEIFWGEKPMDLSFLQYFVRNETLPPEDPWAAGMKMQYYYLGCFMYALLVKITGIAVGVGYNLALVTVASSLLAAMFSLLLFLTRAPFFALISTLLVFFSSNLEWILLYFWDGKELNFDLFWATTRLFTSPAFAEYPLWSFLFGDLHPHVIAQPLAVAVTSMIVALFLPGRDIERRGVGQRIVAYLFLAFLWNLLLPINTWDGVTSLVVMGVVVIFIAVVDATYSRSVGGALVARTLQIGALGASLYAMQLCVAPYLATMPRDKGWNWISDPEFNSAWQLLRHTGGWLLPSVLVGSALLVARMRGVEAGADGRDSSVMIIVRRTMRHPIFAAVAWALIVATPLIFSSFASVYGRSLPPSGIIVGSACVCGVLVLLALFSWRDESLERSIALVLGGVALMVLAEVIFVMDRMNTIFKFYQLVWPLIACGALGILHTGVRTRSAMARSFSTFLLSGALLFSAVPLAVALIGGNLMTGIMVSFQRIPGPRPTLDGQAYLRQSSPDEAFVFDWITKNVSGTPVLLEAWGDSYREFTRGCMHTGLPVVLGWEYHTQQRGASLQETTRRKEDVREMYQSPRIERRLSLLRHYQVKYVLVGEPERRQYTEAAVRMFSQYPMCFRNVVKHNGVLLYEFIAECAPV